MIEASEITIQLQGVSIQETLRLKEVIHTLVANGSLNIRNGRCIIHFDNNAIPMKIEHEFIKWSKKHNTPT